MPSSLDGKERWQRQGPGSRPFVSSRSRPSTPRDPSRVHVQTLARRTNARNPVSHACDGQVGRKPRLANVRRSAVFENHQFSSCISQVVPRLPAPLQEWCAPSPCAPRGCRPGLPRHRSRTRRRFRPRWFTTCSTKLLSVTY